MLLILSHLAACGWYAVAYHTMTGLISDDDEGSWVEDQGLEGKPIWRTYIAAFYFSIATGTTVGYGDIHPVNAAEQLSASLLLVASVAYIGNFLARVSQMV